MLRSYCTVVSYAAAPHRTRRASEAPSSLRERGWDRKVWDEDSSAREVARCVQLIYQKDDLRWVVFHMLMIDVDD